MSTLNVVISLHVLTYYYRPSKSTFIVLHTDSVGVWVSCTYIHHFDKQYLLINLLYAWVAIKRLSNSALVHIQDEQIKWMEAIKPGSSSSVGESTSRKGTVDDGFYSYVQVTRSPLLRRTRPASLYDEPHSHSSQLNESGLAKWFHDNTNFQCDDVLEPTKASETSSCNKSTPRHGSLSGTRNSSTVTPQPTNQQDDRQLKNEGDRLKEAIQPLVGEGTEEELEKLDQYQFQLRILDHMQRLVQRLEDASDESINPSHSQSIVLETDNVPDIQGSTISIPRCSSESLKFPPEESALTISKEPNKAMLMCPYACTNTLAGSSESQKHSNRHPDPLEMPEPHKAPMKQGVSTTRSCADQAMQSSETPSPSSLPVPDLRSSRKVETLATELFPSSFIGGLYENLDGNDYEIIC